LPGTVPKRARRRITPPPAAAGPGIRTFEAATRTFFGARASDDRRPSARLHAPRIPRGSPTRPSFSSRSAKQARPDEIRGFVDDHDRLGPSPRPSRPLQPVSSTSVCPGAPAQGEIRGAAAARCGGPCTPGDRKFRARASAGSAGKTAIRVRTAPVRGFGARKTESARPSAPQRYREPRTRRSRRRRRIWGGRSTRSALRRGRRATKRNRHALGQFVVSGA